MEAIAAQGDAAQGDNAGDAGDVEVEGAGEGRGGREAGGEVGGVAGDGAEAIAAVAEVVVHVAEGGEGDGAALAMDLGDGSGEVGVALVTADGHPVLAAGVFGVGSEAEGAVVAEEDEGVVGGGGGVVDDAGDGVFGAVDVVAAGVEVVVFPVGAAPTKGSGSDDAEVEVGEVEASVADFAGAEEVELGLEAVFLGAIVGAFGAAPGAGAVPGVVVAEDDGFGELEGGDGADDFDGFVAEVTDEEGEVDAQRFSEGFEEVVVEGFPLFMDVADEGKGEGARHGGLFRWLRVTA